MSSSRAGSALQNRWFALSVISLGTFATTLDAGMASVSFPALTEAFHTDTSTVLWVTVAFYVTSVGLLLTLGWVGDVAGRRRVFSLGFVVFTVGMLLAAGSLNIWQLIGARVLQGVGSSMILSNLNALVATTFREDERGKTMGFSAAVAGAGLSLGPLLGGLLLDVLDWRALFYTRAPIGLLGAALGWWVLPRDRVSVSRFRIDFLGAAALFGTLASLLLVVNQGGRLGFGSPVIAGLALASGFFLPLLVWTQRRAIRPIVDFSLFRGRQYLISLILVISHYMSHTGIMLAAPFFFIDARGFSPAKMGLFVATFYIARSFVAPAAGGLSDRIGPRPFLVLGNVILSVALLWLSRLGMDAGEPELLFAMLLAGVGSGIFELVVTSFIMGSVPEDRLGTASASIATGRHIAFSVGVGIAGAVFVIRQRVYLAEVSVGAVASQATEAEAVAHAFSDTLLAGVILSAVAAGVAFAARRGKRPAVTHHVAAS